MTFLPERQNLIFIVLALPGLTRRSRRGPGRAVKEEAGIDTPSGPFVISLPPAAVRGRGRLSFDQGEKAAVLRSFDCLPAPTLGIQAQIRPGLKLCVWSLVEIVRIESDMSKQSIRAHIPLVN